MTVIFDLAQVESLTHLLDGSYVPRGIEYGRFQAQSILASPTKENSTFLTLFLKVLCQVSQMELDPAIERDLDHQVENFTS